MDFQSSLDALVDGADLTIDLSDDFAGEFETCIAYFTADDDAPVELIGWALGGLALTREQLCRAKTASWVSSLEVIAANKWDAEAEARELNRGDDANDWAAE